MGNLNYIDEYMREHEAEIKAASKRVQEEYLFQEQNQKEPEKVFVPTIKNKCTFYRILAVLEILSIFLVNILGLIAGGISLLILSYADKSYQDYLTKKSKKYYAEEYLKLIKWTKIILFIGALYLIYFAGYLIYHA